MTDSYKNILDELKLLVKSLSVLKTRIRGFRQNIGKEKDKVEIAKIRKSLDLS
ncbi:MAG: hypothetical protein ACD_76C00057G0004 [uncultured bacterium]|nr:MAG: hypothetical protein ACD_76C00057G0004 [uncultured bacterium]